MSRIARLFRVTGDEEFECEGTRAIAEAVARVAHERGRAALVVQRVRKDGAPWRGCAPIRLDARPFSVLRGLDVRCPTSLAITRPDFEVLQAVRLEASGLYDALRSGGDA